MHAKLICLNAKITFQNSFEYYENNLLSITYDKHIFFACPIYFMHQAKFLNLK